MVIELPRYILQTIGTGYVTSLLHVDIGDFVEGQQKEAGDCGDWRLLTRVGSVSYTTVTYSTLL